MQTASIAAYVGCLATLGLSQPCGTEAADWPMFRGPGGSSVAQDADLPHEWSVANGKNIAWRVDLPGRGVSGPIVVAGKVFVTASSGENRDRLHVLAFDSVSGEQLWHRRFWATGRTLCHETSAVAAPTPVSDGRRIYAYFSSNDVVALDLSGNVRWMRGLALDFPGAGNDIGLSSSPVVSGDVVLVQCEAQGNSFVAAMDAEDGANRWSLDRPQKSNWSSPLALTDQLDDGPVDYVVLQSAAGLSAYRAETGQLLWEQTMACSTIPSLVFRERLYVPADGIQVLEVSSQGPAHDGVVWQESKLNPGHPSPVVVDDQVFVINSAGVLTCGSLESKEIVWRKRLGGTFWATPVAAGNHLFCVNSVGKSFVVDRSDKGRIVSESEFGEDILASPAVADNGLFVRSHQHLWKIAHEFPQ